MERFLRGTALQGASRFWGTVGRHPSVIIQQCSFSASSTTSSSSSAGRGASRRLYRILQRQCVEFANALPFHSSGETMFLFQPGLNPIHAGRHRILSVNAVMPEDDVRNLLVFFRDWNEDNGDEDAHDWLQAIQKEDDDDYSDVLLDFTYEPSLWTTVSSIQKAIRYAFRHANEQAEEGSPKFRQLMNKYAIRAVMSLTEQAEIWRLSSVSYDKDIRVVATSKFVGRSHMGPRRTAEVKNRFNYRIRIENLSDQESVQLLGRNWHIQELESQAEEDTAPIIVDAPNSGAVGQLPVLRPGDAFEYISGCELPTTKGVMTGSFHLAKVPMDTPSATLSANIAAFSSPDRFEVEVNPFPLEAAAAADSDE